MSEILKSMTFQNGRVIVDDPNGISYIGPCSDKLNEEELMALMKEHGFLEEEDDSNVPQQ
jgi:hypothetical protein